MRQIEVEHHEVGLVVGHLPDRGAPVGGRSHDHVARRQRALDGAKDLRIVVDDQDDGLAHGAPWRRNPNVAPPPGVSVAQISPPIAVTNPLEIARPSPAPSGVERSSNR